MVTLGSARRPLPPPEELADALRTAAQTLGDRPAVTVLRADRREEQGFASLAQWAAKGAHLLEMEHLLEPGDRLALVGPPGWLPAAVCLAAWWAGVTVTLDGGAPVAVVHEACQPPPDAEEVLSFGDALDGSPTSSVGALGDAEPWPVAVQLFPDQPPRPRADPDLPALESGGRSWTQREVLEEVAGGALEGPLGVDAGPGGPDGGPAARAWLPAVAVRPLRSGQPTVVLAGADRRAAAKEGVGTWL